MTSERRHAAPVPTPPNADVASLLVVRDCIARAVLIGAPVNDNPVPESAADATFGEIRLRPAQRESLARVQAALHEFGGALLADPPGLGKTFVALAAAHSAEGALVAAPAALRAMWRDAAQRAQVTITFVSLEQLSQGARPVRAPFVIVDEAHHGSNPATRRYRALAALCAGTQTLLLTATPVRNRATELDALLALIVGPAAARMQDADRARLLVRRDAPLSDRPRIAPTRWTDAPIGTDYATMIRALPPPLATRDGRSTRALVSIGLARAWASSAAALDETLRRRIARGLALDDTLATGNLPTTRELRAWLIGDDAVQLAFPLLQVDAASPLDAFSVQQHRTALRAHIEAVQTLRASVTPAVAADARARAARLRQILARHPGERAVAFTQHAATAMALWRELRATAGTALLTGSVARTVSGPRSRAELLQILGGERPTATHDDIRLAISTDVLSEGVNLTGTSVIVHLDTPWTPAALEQRAGRAARMGAQHSVVTVYGIRAPQSANHLLQLDARLARKRRAHTGAVGGASAASLLCEAVRPWLGVVPAGIAPGDSLPRPDRAPASSPSVAWQGQSDRVYPSAACAAHHAGFIAVLFDGSRRWLTSSRGPRPADLLTLVRAARCAPVATPVRLFDRARRRIIRDINAAQAHQLTGADGSGSGARTTLLRRVDAMVAQAPAHQRATLAAAAAALHRALDTARGAGVEAALRAINADASANLPTAILKWVTTTTETVSALARPKRNTGAAEDSAAPVRLIALLLLVPEARPTPASVLPVRARRRVPTAAST